MEKHLKSHTDMGDESQRNLGNFWWTLQLYANKLDRSPTFGEVIRNTDIGWKCGSCNFFCAKEGGMRNHLAQSHADIAGSLRGTGISKWKGALVPLFGDEANRAIVEHGRRLAANATTPGTPSTAQSNTTLRGGNVQQPAPERHRSHHRGRGGRAPRQPDSV